MTQGDPETLGTQNLLQPKVPYKSSDSRMWSQGEGTPTFLGQDTWLNYDFSYAENNVDAINTD